MLRWLSEKKSHRRKATPIAAETRNRPSCPLDVYCNLHHEDVPPSSPARHLLADGQESYQDVCLYHNCLPSHLVFRLFPNLERPGAIQITSQCSRISLPPPRLFSNDSTTHMVPDRGACVTLHLWRQHPFGVWKPGVSFPRSRRLENSAQDPSKSEKGHPYRTSAPKGEGESAKSGQERTWGGGGVRGKMRTSAKSKIFSNCLIFPCLRWKYWQQITYENHSKDTFYYKSVKP